MTAHQAKQALAYLVALLVAVQVGALHNHVARPVILSLALWLWWYHDNHVAQRFGNYERMNFEALTDFEVQTFFRFTKADINELCDKLHIPDVIRTKTGYKFTNRDALLVLLWRLSYPNRWADGVKFFGRGRSSLSEITHWMLKFMTENYAQLLRMPSAYNTPECLRRMADAIHNRCPMSTVAGFIDCTLRGICRPFVGQQAAYSGHKKIHGLKYQNVISADGMIIDQWGPAEGRHSDAWLLRESQLLGRLCAHWKFSTALPAAAALHTPAQHGAPSGIQHGPAGPFIQYSVYGDKGYYTHWTGAIIASIKRAAGQVALSADEQDFNTCMSRARIAVEWCFLKVVQKWGYLDHKKQIKVFGGPVASYYITASLLTNFHSCLHGNQTSTYFNVPPPSLDAYLAMVPSY